MPGNFAFTRPRQRLAAAVTGISLAIIAVLWLDLADSRRLAIENARAVSDNLSRLLSERLDGSVREVDYVLRDLVDVLSTTPYATRDAKSAALDRLVQAKLSTIPQASSLVVLDPWGRPFSSNPGGPSDETARSYIQAFAADGSLLASTQAVFGAGYGGGTGADGSVGAALIRARAIRDANGALLAVVAARIDVAQVQSKLADLELGQKRTIAVTDHELRLIARKPELPGAVGVEVVDAAMRSLLRSLKEASPALSPGPGAMRSETGPYFYYARVGEFPFYIAVSEARADIMAEWTKRLAIYGSAVAAIIILLILLARLVDRNLSRGAELAARLVAMESTSDMIVIADLDGKAEYVNPSFERATGMSRSAAIGSRKAIFGLEEADADAALAAAAAGQSWRGEIEALRADGEGIVEEVTIAPVPGPGGEPVRIVAVLRDVTERRRLHERLERLAHYDSLTALPNRALFFDRLEGAVARARREERRFALLFIDLDGFKAVNDRFGHDAGDYLLFEIARRLRAAIRDSDTAGRMGGDEFTVLLDNITRPEDAAAVADKIRSSLTEPIAIPSGSRVQVGASVGIAVFPDDGNDGDTVLKAADSAMYAIKLAEGRR
jgi:diguanylate cyclase (GGDEF)-like protein/PAS domain S-box-containing protein